MTATDAGLLAKQARDNETKQALATLVLKADDTTGEFEAVFSTFGVVDSDDDIVMSSAIPNGKEVPVVWHHRWDQIVGKGVVSIQGDQAVIRGRFFIETTAGMEAYKTVKAMGTLQEYSWGFRIKEASYEQREERWIRIIKVVDIYEVSPVLRGAGVGTYTMAMKGGQPLGEQFDTTLAVVQDLIARVKSLADLREKAGRALSEANRQRLAAVAEQLESASVDIRALLDATAPEKEVDAEAMLKQILIYELTLAQQNGITE